MNYLTEMATDERETLITYEIENRAREGGERSTFSFAAENSDVHFPVLVNFLTELMSRLDQLEELKVSVKCDHDKFMQKCEKVSKMAQEKESTTFSIKIVLKAIVPVLPFNFGFLGYYVVGLADQHFCGAGGIIGAVCGVWLAIVAYQQYCKLALTEEECKKVKKEVIDLQTTAVNKMECFDRNSYKPIRVKNVIKASIVRHHTDPQPDVASLKQGITNLFKLLRDIAKTIDIETMEDDFGSINAQLAVTQ